MMKKVLITLMMCAYLFNGYAQTSSSTLPTNNVQIELNLKLIDESPMHKGIHRTPPASPVVFLNAAEHELYFDSPCYDCALQLVNTETEEVAFSTVIPDGAQEISLPSDLSGEYELQIIRGQYMFYTTIDL